MKLLKAELEQIIKEEIEKLLSEAPSASFNQPGRTSGVDTGKIARKRKEREEFFKAAALKKGRNQMEKPFTPAGASAANPDAALVAQAEKDAESDREIPSVEDFQKMYDKSQKQKEFEKASAASAAAAAKYQASYNKPRSKAAKQNILSKKIRMPLKKIQGALFKKGYAPKGVTEREFVDGKYGGMTETAIEDLQDDLGFKGKQVDGLYGGGTHGRWKKSGFVAAKRSGNTVAKKPAKKPAVPLAKLQAAAEKADLDVKTAQLPGGGQPPKDHPGLIKLKKRAKQLADVYQLALQKSKARAERQVATKQSR